MITISDNVLKCPSTLVSVSVFQSFRVTFDSVEHMLHSQRSFIPEAYTRTVIIRLGFRKAFTSWIRLTVDSTQISNVKTLNSLIHLIGPLIYLSMYIYVYVELYSEYGLLTWCLGPEFWRNFSLALWVYVEFPLLFTIFERSILVSLY